MTELSTYIIRQECSHLVSSLPLKVFSNCKGEIVSLISWESN